MRMGFFLKKRVGRFRNLFFAQSVFFGDVKSKKNGFTKIISFKC